MGRKRPVHAASPHRPGPRWGLIFALAAAIATLATAGGVIAAVRQSNAPVPTPTPLTLSTRIDGIPCNNDNVTYHEHAFLAIVVNGKDVAVPANVGIPGDTCLYWLHTHDNSGEIHLEAPVARPFTLGEFFDVWGKTLSNTEVADYRVGSRQPLKVYVNLKPYGGDPRAIGLQRHTLITLEVGPPFRPPETFDFQGD